MARFEYHTYICTCKYESIYTRLVAYFICSLWCNKTNCSVLYSVAIFRYIYTYLCMYFENRWRMKYAFTYSGRKRWTFRQEMTKPTSSVIYIFATVSRCYGRFFITFEFFYIYVYICIHLYVRIFSTLQIGFFCIAIPRYVGVKYAIYYVDS